MYDGNQVIRFENKFKAKDLGGLGIELTERKGTGNYDKNRTKFNYAYVPLTNYDFRSSVYLKLNDNNIYYNKGKNTNLVNGAIVTSGKEFFQSLGMNFIDGGRKHQKGKNKGKPILIPDIKSKDDIPKEVTRFFDDSFEFLSNLVGKENIIYAEIHYDEDTPHMHFYFLPVVNEVKRKVFEKDKDGNLIKKEVISKDGKVKLLPIQMKDEKGKGVVEIEKGKFLNCDQFWKQLGGKLSFAKIQDDYNEYITNKGFNLSRGNIGSNAFHLTKAEKELEDLNIQINDMKKEFEKNRILNEIQLETNKELSNVDSKEIFNPIKKKIIGYSDNDINKLIDYSKNIQKENINNEGIIKEQDLKINDMYDELYELTEENEKLKDGRAIKERDEKIYEQEELISKQKQIIREKNSIIKNLENKLVKVQESFDNFKIKMFDFCNKICRALAHKLGHHYEIDEDINYDKMEYHANRVNYEYDHPRKDKSNDRGLSL